MHNVTDGNNGNVHRHRIVDHYQKYQRDLAGLQESLAVFPVAAQSQSLRNSCAIPLTQHRRKFLLSLLLSCNLCVPLSQRLRKFGSCSTLFLTQLLYLSYYSLKRRCDGKSFFCDSLYYRFRHLLQFSLNYPSCGFSIRALFLVMIGERIITRSRTQGSSKRYVRASSSRRCSRIRVHARPQK